VLVGAEHFRVYAVDIVGEPGRSAPARPPLGSDDYAGWLDDVFDALGLARASLVGASLGAWLALDYATRRLLRSLTIATGLDGPQVRPFLDYLTVIHRHFRPRTQRLPVFSDDRLGTLTMPVLVIVGDRDAMLDSHDTVRRLDHAVPHSVTTLLPGVGHSIVGQAVPVLGFLKS
jgi:pimeloyl-ACP methyl ester carboxylesterase